MRLVTKLVSLARSLLSHPTRECSRAAQHERCTRASWEPKEWAATPWQLPTDNIKRRPSHIYIAPQVPAQPHARPTTGLSYEIRKRAQQTWIGPTGAVALHTTGETRNPWRSHVRLPQGDDTQSARRHSEGRAFIKPAPEDKEQDRAQVVA